MKSVESPASLTVVRGICFMVPDDLTVRGSVICSPVSRVLDKPIPVSKGTANLAILCFGKRLQCLSRDVSKSSR